MTAFDSIETKSLTLTNAAGEPVVTFSLGWNNDRPQREARLNIEFQGDYPAEIEIIPGKDVPLIPNRKNNIVTQIQLWATSAIAHRKRITMTVARDDVGGEYGIVDSTTNDPSNSEGQSKSMPLLVNVGEGKGIYYGLYASDNTFDLQDRGAKVSTGRTLISEMIKRIKGK